MSKAAQGFALRRTDGTPQTALSQAAGGKPAENAAHRCEASLGDNKDHLWMETKWVRPRLLTLPSCNVKSSAGSEH
jgi:hypothetical protein